MDMEMQQLHSIQTTRSRVKNSVESAARDFAVKKLDKALETLNQLLEDISTAPPDLTSPNLIACVQYNIGIIYMEKGDLQKAASYFENILQQYNSLGEIPNELTNLTDDLSIVYL